VPGQPPGPAHAGSGAFDSIVPNPSGGQTAFRFRQPESGPIEFTVHDIAGRLVRVLTVGPRDPAEGNAIVWDGRDALGRAAPSGVYLCRVRSGCSTIEGKVLLAR
jgi:hypothetical protein